MDRAEQVGMVRLQRAGAPGVIDALDVTEGPLEAVLGLAQTLGWQPARTLPPSGYEGDWDGAYALGQGEWVTWEDARALARAIRSLAGHPEVLKSYSMEEKGALRSLSAWLERGGFAFRAAEVTDVR